MNESIPSPSQKRVKSFFGDAFKGISQMNGNDLSGEESMALLNRLKEFVGENTLTPQGKPDNGAITTHQLRTIYTQALALNPGDTTAMAKLKYKLAYVAGRLKNSRKGENFLCLIELALDHALEQGTKKATDNFKMVMEALVAYHRFFIPKAN